MARGSSATSVGSITVRLVLQSKIQSTKEREEEEDEKKKEKDSRYREVSEVSAILK